jgi:G-patch domain
MQPNKLADYVNSREYLMELDDWKDYLLHIDEQPALRFVEAKNEETGEVIDEDEESFEGTDDPGVEESKEENDEKQDKKTVPENRNIAHRLLKKYGWKPGTGLGAQSSGITRPLKFSMSKKRPGMGRIVDSNVKTPGRFGSSSRVIRITDLLTVEEAENPDILSKLGETFDMVRTNQ